MKTKETILETADNTGLIRVSGDYLRGICLELVREGKLVAMSRYTFSLPCGG